jgi:hypothetical protein
MRTPLGIPNAVAPNGNGREPWQQTYIDWFTGKANLRLRDKARKELDRCYVEVKLNNGDGSQPLSKLLLECAQTGEIPGADVSGAERQRRQITSNATAERLWKEAKASLVLYFLDTLLNRLAREAKVETKPDSSASPAASGTQDGSLAGEEGGNGR